MWAAPGLVLLGEWDHDAGCPGGGDTGMRWSCRTMKYDTAQCGKKRGLGYDPHLCLRKAIYRTTVQTGENEIVIHNAHDTVR